MLRIFLTGDNHIGLKYASHEKSTVLAQSRISAFEGMVKKANAEECDLFIVSGDLFEKNYGIAKKDVSAVLKMLSDFNGTVVVLPGNHDYYDDDAKVWQYFKGMLSDYDNIMLLTEYKPYELTGEFGTVVIYPALCTSLHSEPRKNNLSWIKNENIIPDTTYRIGIAHGAVEGETIDNEGRYFLMSRDELESINVDAWFIGHTHVPFPRNLTESLTSGEKIFNAGTHVQTDVNCNSEGQCFIVEIDEDKTVRAKKFVSGNLRFYRREIEVSAGNAEEILLRELADIPDNSVVDVIIKGAVSEEEYENRHKIADSVLSRFIEGTYNDGEMSKVISESLIEKEFAQTSVSAKLLFALMDEPKEAQLAYELLKSLKEAK